MPRSIIGWFVVCWSAFVLASVVVGVLLLSLYRQTTTEQVRRASAAVAHGCDAIAGRYQFLVAGTNSPPSDLRAPEVVRGLTWGGSDRAARPSRRRRRHLANRAGLAGLCIPNL